MPVSESQRKRSSKAARDTKSKIMENIVFPKIFSGKVLYHEKSGKVDPFDVKYGGHTYIVQRKANKNKTMYKAGEFKGQPSGLFSKGTWSVVKYRPSKTKKIRTGPGAGRKCLEYKTGARGRRVCAKYSGTKRSRSRKSRTPALPKGLARSISKHRKPRVLKKPRQCIEQRTNAKGRKVCAKYSGTRTPRKSSGRVCVKWQRNKAGRRSCKEYMKADLD